MSVSAVPVDVVVLGGGAVGCATAVALLRHAPALSVHVLEPDPTYAHAATPRSSGGIRTLFSRPENIALSRYALEVIQTWDRFNQTPSGSDVPPLGWRAQGYLFVVAPAHVEQLRRNLATQVAAGIHASWLSPAATAERFPQLATDDLGGAVWSPDDGWLDPWALLVGLRRTAADLGAVFVRDRAQDLHVAGTRVDRLELAGGDAISPGSVVNAAGVWAADLAAAVNMPIPVEPMRRFEHVVRVAAAVDDLPFVKDPSGLAVRPEGDGLSVGLVDFNHPGGFDLTVDHGYFDRAVWPALAHRLPGADRARLVRTTAGLYDQNRLDGNPVIGNWPGQRDNFYLACGFSGHGLMHALGTGRALAELIIDGAYSTIDLTPFGYERVLTRQPYPELGIR
jgi:FAD-dependent oxidoreductase domain-containing protein 1